jgi:hypothetical protein
MVLLACVTTPLYQREYFQKHTFSVRNWSRVVGHEFRHIIHYRSMIKVVADGFFGRPMPTSEARGVSLTGSYLLRFGSMSDLSHAGWQYREPWSVQGPQSVAIAQC